MHRIELWHSESRIKNQTVLERNQNKIEEVLTIDNLWMNGINVLFCWTLSEVVSDIDFLESTYSLEEYNVW